MKTVTIKPPWLLGFTRRFISLNQPLMQDFGAWHFQPGMRFQEKAQWWRPGFSRSTPHEGVDFCCFKDKAGELVYLRPGCKIPALFKGRVAALFDDFLGRSLYIVHKDNGCQLSGTIYAHIQPVPEITVGRVVEAGEVVGVTAPQRRSGPLRSHLHLSMCRAAKNVPPPTDWQTIHHLPIELINPFS
ncbi:MAG TPA: hypothetical protein ENK33_07060 [Desulfobacterales bacterium]|nr:hypothetical protein [Desulfobacterales bacterium]